MNEKGRSPVPSKPIEFIIGVQCAVIAVQGVPPRQTPQGIAATLPVTAILPSIALMPTLLCSSGRIHF